ncbi:MAG: DegV family protein [Clostridia bacterium]|nr:DegV family protein [Clostridia bacterium]
MVKIISDSTCDLSQDLIEKYDVDILPLHVILGDRDFEDGRTITPDEIYRWSDENRQTPKTAAVSVEEVEKSFVKYLEDGAEIVCFAISESMSSTANAMRLAAQRLEAENRVTVVDSANLSTGVGLLVIEAARMARAGMNARQIVEIVEKLKPRVRASFVVDTLTFLHRGGRCSGAAALVGGTLKLHPRIAVENGKMAPGKKYRGRMSRAIMDYVQDMEADLKAAKTDRVFITHSGCAQADIDAVRAYLESLNHFEEILITRAGSVISSHCGPGTLGVLFISEK